MLAGREFGRRFRHHRLVLSFSSRKQAGRRGTGQAIQDCPGRLMGPDGMVDEGFEVFP